MHAAPARRSHLPQTDTLHPEIPDRLQAIALWVPHSTRHYVSTEGGGATQSSATYSERPQAKMGRRTWKQTSRPTVALMPGAEYYLQKCLLRVKANMQKREASCICQQFNTLQQAKKPLGRCLLQHPSMAYQTHIDCFLYQVLCISAPLSLSAQRSHDRCNS